MQSTSISRGKPAALTPLNAPIHPFKAKAVSVKFGSTTTNLTATLPAWAKAVPDPRFTRSEYNTLYWKKYGEYADEMCQNFAKGKNNKVLAPYLFLKLYLYNLWLKGKLKVARHRAKNLLPAEVTQRIRKYKWFSLKGWWDWLSNKGRYKRTLIALQGPIAIKKQQSWVQTENAGPRGKYEEFLQRTKTWKGRRELLTDAPWFMKAISPILFPLTRFITKRLLKEIDIYYPLLHKVPELPKSYFEASLQQLTNGYNAQPGVDPIIKVGDPIASGSMGQVYEAKTRSGKTLVLKVLRPDANKDFLEKCREYLYYMELVETGKEPIQKRSAYLETESHIQFLIGEADLRDERGNAEKLNAEKIRLNIDSLDIPIPLFATKTGMVMNKVGTDDLANLKSAEREAFRLNVVPGMAKLTLLSASKPLDSHDGNYRQGPKPLLIDHGRQANLNPLIHQTLLKLMVLFFAYQQGSASEISSPVLLTLGELFGSDQNNPWYTLTDAVWSGQQYITDLRQDIQALELAADEASKAALTAKQAELKQAEAALQPQQTQLTRFINRLFTGVDQSIASIKDKVLQGQSTVLLEEGDYLTTPSLYSVWANYELLTSKQTNGLADLPKLSEKPVSKIDIELYFKKFRDFVMPYFWTAESPQADAQLIAQIQTQSTEDFLAHFSVLSDLGQVHETVSQGLAQLNAAQTTNEISKIQEALDKIKAAVHEILKQDSSERQRLLKIYRIHARHRQFTQERVQELLAETGIALDETAKNQFIQRLEKALREDFHLDPQHYLEKKPDII